MRQVELVIEFPSAMSDYECYQSNLYSLYLNFFGNDCPRDTESLKLTSVLCQA